MMSLHIDNDQPQQSQGGNDSTMRTIHDTTLQQQQLQPPDHSSTRRRHGRNSNKKRLGALVYVRHGKTDHLANLVIVDDVLLPQQPPAAAGGKDTTATAPMPQEHEFTSATTAATTNNHDSSVSAGNILIRYQTSGLEECVEPSRLRPFFLQDSIRPDDAAAAAAAAAVDKNDPSQTSVAKHTTNHIQRRRRFSRRTRRTPREADAAEEERVKQEVAEAAAHWNRQQQQQQQQQQQLIVKQEEEGMNQEDDKITKRSDVTPKQNPEFAAKAKKITAAAANGKRQTKAKHQTIEFKFIDASPDNQSRSSSADDPAATKESSSDERSSFLDFSAAAEEASESFSDQRTSSSSFSAKDGSSSDQSSFLEDQAAAAAGKEMVSDTNNTLTGRPQRERRSVAEGQSVEKARIERELQIARERTALMRQDKKYKTKQGQSSPQQQEPPTRPTVQQQQDSAHDSVSTPPSSKKHAKCLPEPSTTTTAAAADNCPATDRSKRQRRSVAEGQLVEKARIDRELQVARERKALMRQKLRNKTKQDQSSPQQQEPCTRPTVQGHQTSAHDSDSTPPPSKKRTKTAIGRALLGQLEDDDGFVAGSNVSNSEPTASAKKKTKTRAKSVLQHDSDDASIESNDDWLHQDEYNLSSWLSQPTRDSQQTALADGAAKRKNDVDSSSSAKSASDDGRLNTIERRSSARERLSPSVERIDKSSTLSGSGARKRKPLDLTTFVLPHFASPRNRASSNPQTGHDDEDRMSRDEILDAVREVFAHEPWGAFQKQLEERVGSLPVKHHINLIMREYLRLDGIPMSSQSQSQS